MANLISRDRYYARLGIVNARTGELSSYGEMLAEEHYYKTGIPDDVGDSRFDEMGPDLMPDTNVVFP